MAKKKKGLHISEENLESMMRVFGSVEKGPCKNEAQHLYIYTIDTGELKANVAVYFRGDNTITCVKQGSGACEEKSQEIVSYIEENAEYKNVSSGTFTCKFTKDKFDNLTKYLESLEGVRLISEKDKGTNGLVRKFIINMGDSIALTFWQTTGKMCFQGYLMLLHVEVKSFISAYEYVKTELDINDKAQKSKKELIVKQKIQQLMPTSYDKLDSLFQDYIYDSIIQVVMRNELREYSAWAFPVLKALEGRTKQILDYNKIRINDKIGFKIRVSRNPDEYKNIFLFNDGKHVVDTSIVSINDVNTLNALSDCYTFICKNRNTLFHIKQTIVGTRTLDTPEEAESIIYDACEIIEKSYTLIKK